MNEDEKRAVVERLERYVRLKGSQKKASNSLDGVSSATINKMLRGTWDDIADPMWRNLANQLGGSTERTWQIAPTKAYRKMGFLLAEAQRNSLTLGIVGSAGTGKSEAVRQYAETHSNVYHLACAEFWRKKVFVQQLVKSLGCGAQGGTVEELMDVAVSTKFHFAPRWRNSVFHEAIWDFLGRSPNPRGYSNTQSRAVALRSEARSTHSSVIVLCSS